MTESALKSINCTQCSAPLTLHGGHRVESITCGYCGSVLDTKDEFRVLKKFTDIKRPVLPLQIGQQGKIKGIEFTIIGVIQYHAPSEYSFWLEYLLFSPTHGYAWLEHDYGHFVFSRRVRDMPEDKVIQTYKAPFKARGHTFKVFGFYTASITYVEGELTWVAEIGDKVHLVEGIAPPYIYAIETTAREKEFIFGEYLDYKEVQQTFGVKQDFIEPYGAHGAQPFKSHPLISSLSRIGAIFTPIALILWLSVLWTGTGQKVFANYINANEYLANKEGASRTFSISQPDRLVALKLRSNLSNAWAWYDIEVVKDGKSLFSMSQQISYYSGYEGGEHWSEGSRNAKAYFKVPEAGEYSFRVWGDGGSGDYGNIPQQSPLIITIIEGVIVSRYYFLLFIISLFSLLGYHLLKYQFEIKRWGDDDD